MNNEHMPDVVLCQELLYVHDGIVHLLLPLALLGDGDCDDGDLLVIVWKNKVISRSNYNSWFKLVRFLELRQIDVFVVCLCTDMLTDSFH